MAAKRMLPVGIEEFDKIRRNNFYYVDKTGLIEDLLDNWAQVSLFTRPRRFGKTLNMSMLKSFFEVGTDPALFEGLRIAERSDLCERYMGQYPVISVSLKAVDGLTYDSARYRLAELVGNEAGRFRCLLTSERLSEEDKNRYRRLIAVDDGAFAMDDKTLASSLQLLSQLLYQHYGRQVIMLIDEYDVPLDKAFQNGYYREMVALIRVFLGNALKTNPYLQMAVLIGCLRVSKESIFTGLNNFKVLSITDVRFDEWFGFTDEEVRQLLADYGLQDHADVVKEWYDGYRFGNTDIYCPWDVINHVDHLKADPLAEPETYWINTSGNDLVKRFIDKADKTTQNELERLVAGETVSKAVRLELTYDELDSSIDNLWSVLFTTGYLTQACRSQGGVYQLVIPNREIREVYVQQIQKWFQDWSLSDTGRINRFCAAFAAVDTMTIQEMLQDYLWDSISVRDTAVRGRMKENFYHGLLLGLLRSQGSWLIRSNAETGEGYSDISICMPTRTGIVIEIKYAQDGNLDAACERALQQIEDRQYTGTLRRQGMREIIRYGIAFYEKDCSVVVGSDHGHAE